MIRYLLFFAGFMFTGFLLNGQSGRPTPSGMEILKHLQEKSNGNGLSIQVDNLLAENYYKFLVQNKKDSGIPGFRIRIYSESGLGAKEEQQRVKASFLSNYPGIDAYNRYDEPYFKVYVGDCRTRSEALKLYNNIKRKFPNPIIVEDYINKKHTD